MANKVTNYRKPIKRSLKRIALGALVSVIAAAFLLLTALWLFPFPESKLTSTRGEREATVVCDRYGQPLRSFRSRDDGWLFWTSIDDMSPYLAQGTIAVEDERFYYHPGVDPLSVARATASNVWCMRKVSGASTLTMQIMRIMDRRPRCLESKLIESFQALQLEQGHQKKELLEIYLNMAPYSGNYSGVEAASQLYFNKPSKYLGLAEAALIAGMPQSPSRLMPHRYPHRALRRRNHVLDRMLACGYISSVECESAKAEPLPQNVHSRSFSAPHFSDMIRQRYPALKKVVTTLDPTIQSLAMNAMQRQLADLDGVRNAAIVVIENETGAVRALIGSPDFLDVTSCGQINGATALRSPGSALKPFVYAMAFERGIATPDGVLPDVAINFNGYVPVNYDHTYHGPVRAAKALPFSYNVPAVYLLNKVGCSDFQETLQKCGITTVKQPAGHYGLTMILGTANVSLLELTNAYAMLARLGKYRPYKLIEGHSSAEGKQVFSPAACYLTATALTDRDRLGPNQLSMPGGDGVKYAWKTGTSYGHHDAWTIAYNQQYTVGVWFGNAAGTPSADLIGIKAAAPVAGKIICSLTDSHRDSWYTKPKQIVERTVCALSGHVAGPDCPKRMTGVGITGISFRSSCQLHGHRTVTVQSNPGRVTYEQESVVNWPSVYQDWLHKTEIKAPKSPSKLQITSPGNGEVFIKHPGQTAGERIALTTTGAEGNVFWFLDGKFLSKADSSTTTFWRPDPGSHQLTCTDDAGKTTKIQFTVISPESTSDVVDVIDVID